jgi:glycosyltransferase involved in cell wall biosynthesis
MNPRVLQVITDTDRRGAQVFATDLGAALGDELSVRTVALAPGREGGLDVDVFGASRLAPSTLRALRSAAGAADVVVAHGSSTLFACAAALLGSGRPFVYRQISDPVFWTPTASRRLRVRVALSRARRVVALWSGSARVLRERFGVSDDRITVVPNGVPTRPAVSADARAAARAHLDVPSDQAVVAYVGALVPEKGVADVVRAIARVPARLLVAGTGPERASLEALARDCAPERVAFLGAVDDPALVYEAADVVVLASRGGDSMPAVLIEAGLTGIACVATPFDAIPEVIVDGETGVLVAPGDGDALANALRDLLADPDRRRVLGAAARARCEARFTIPVVAQQWAAVLRGVVAAAPA